MFGVPYSNRDKYPEREKRYINISMLTAAKRADIKKRGGTEVIYKKKSRLVIYAYQAGLRNYRYEDGGSGLATKYISALPELIHLSFLSSLPNPQRRLFLLRIVALCCFAH